MQHRSFYLNESPSNNGQFIFDEVYKNQQDKVKFSHNPKYAYFNSIIKMRSKLQTDEKVYNSVFHSPRLNEH